MKIAKRIGITLAIIIGLLLGAAIAIPLLFKDELLVALKEQINENVDAVVEFEDVNISLFRHFPNLSVRLDDFSVTGKEEFDGVRLAAGESLDLTLDLWSILSSSQPDELKSIHLEKPEVNVYVLRNGKANYDIVATDSTATADTTAESSDFLVKLQSYSISDGKLVYNDQTLPVIVEAKGLNHSGSGDFTATVFDLDTETEIDTLTVDYDGVAYLTNAHLTLDAKLNANLDEMKFTLMENDLLVNAMHLQADGFVQLPETGDDIGLDLTFNAPENEFKNLLSLIPNAFIEGYEDVQAEGQFQFDGFVKGTYSPASESYPTFQLQLNVAEANVQYPDLPLGITDIHTQASVNSPTSNLNDMVVDVPDFNLQIGSNPIGGRFNLKTPISDPNIDTRIEGVLDLAELAQAFPMEGVQDLKGTILADITAQTRLSTIENEDYANANVKGKLGVQNVVYNANGLPNIQVQGAQVDFNPQNVAIENFNAQLGQSDVQATGTIDNILAYFSPNKKLTGQFNIRSNYFNADEWMTTSESSAEAVPTATSAPQPEETELPLENFDFDITAEIAELDYDIYKMSDLSTRANVTSNALTLDQFAMQINGSELTATGAVTNLFNFLFYNEILRGAVNLDAPLIDINGLMPEATEESESTAATTESTATVPPYRYNIDLQGSIDRLIYDVYNLTGITTTGNITEDEITIESFRGNIEGSPIEGEGNITNYLEYALLGDTLRGTLNLRSTDFDVNPFMMSEEASAEVAQATSPEELEPIVIPGNVKMTINANMSQVRYTDMVLRNMQGALEIAEGRMMIENATADIFGGKLNMSGGYDTQVPEKPSVNMKFDLQNIAFQESFSALNTFQALAPIGRFIQGRLNTSLVFSSELGSDMMPDLSTIDAQGFLQTINAVIQGFKPLEAVGNKLNVDYFKTMQLQDTKNWFEISDGVVELKPVDFEFNDIALQVSGKHGLDMDMDYDIQASIPRELIGQSTIGAAANQGLSFIQNQASKLGLNVGSGTHVNLAINLGGSLNNPDVGIDVLGFGGKQAPTQVSEEETQQSVTEEVKEEAQEQIETGKEQVKETVQQAKDSLKNVASQKVDSLKTGITAKADSAKAEVKEEIKDAAKESVENIKKELENFNPFKKKKKDGGGR